MYLKLAENSKVSADRTRLLDKAAELARELGDRKTLAQVEGQFTSKGIEPQSSRLVVEQAELALKQGELSKAFNTSKKIIAKDELPKDILARARFVQAQVLEDEYRRQSVKARVERVGLVLAIKTEKLEKAQKAYQSAIRYGDAAVSVKALRQLAGCYLDYSKTVRAMELPSSVSAADAEAFKNEIEQLAIPMEEKGIEAIGQALETAKKAQLRSGEIAALEIELGKLNMKPVEPGVTTVAKPEIYLPRFVAGQEVKP
jgi:hypothetical protein